jgi:hypothetical protein
VIDLLTTPPAALWSMAVALGARNGMEDLHHQGVVDDEHMPTLNRALRSHLYDAFSVVKAVVDGAHPAEDDLMDWLGERIDLDCEDPLVEVVPGAVLDAVAEAVDRLGLDEGIVEPLAQAGERGAREHLGILFEQPQDPDKLGLLIAMIPDYWEAPELSDEVAALLGAAAG